MKLPPFSVSPFAPAGLFVILFALPAPYSFSIVASALVHELGHAAAALLLGKKLLKITFMPVGITMTMTPASSYREEILIALAGPFQNLLLIFASPLFPACSEEISRFSVLYLAINLLPMASLDGGRVLYASVARFFGESAGEKTVRTLTSVCLVALWIIAVYIFFYTAENAALLIFCSYIFAAVIIAKSD